MLVNELQQSKLEARLLGVRRWSSRESWEKGAPEGNRTPNRRIRSAVLYPLSYERLYVTVFMLPCRPVNVKRAPLTP